MKKQKRIDLIFQTWKKAHGIPKYNVVFFRWLFNNSERKEKQKALYQIWNETEAVADQKTHDTLDELLKTDAATGTTKLVLPNGHKNGFKLFLKYAAIFLLPLASSLLTWSYLSAQHENVEFMECYVEKGCQESITLSDGTIVKLNSGSYLSYPNKFIGSKRGVYLLGEAYFSVKKDEEKPFVVDVGNLKIQVVGTKFNVNAYPDNKEILTTLVAGCVKICQRNDVTKIFTLHPNEQLKYDKENHTFVQNKVDLYYPLLWLEGSMVLESKTLPEILTALERQFKMDFVLLNENVSPEKYKVIIQKEDTLNDVMGILSNLIKGFSYEIKNNSVLVSVKER